MSADLRRILVDTPGLLLAVMVPSTAIQDRDGARWLSFTAAASLPMISLLWGDGGCAGQRIERTFAWLEP